MTLGRLRRVAVFGASGAIAGAVARAFAKPGVRLLLSSRETAPPADFAVWLRGVGDSFRVFTPRRQRR